MELAKYMFFKSCKERNVDRTEEFYKLTGLLYNPAKNVPKLVEDEGDDEDIIFTDD